METTALKDWGIFPDTKPCIIAGPCSAESESQLMETAVALRDLGVGVFRAGIWKPRTRPGCFEGVGVEGLPWLQRVKSELGMKVCTEVAGEKHVREALAHGVDMVWIGARTTANPFLVQEIADALRGSSVPVLVKNPVSPDLGLWIGAIERLYGAGITKIGVIHRGFTSLDEHRYRNSPRWQLAIDLRSRFPQLPFFCDPSHMAGCREYVPELSQRAMNLGLDGLMIESHCNPSVALSDASQQLAPEDLGRLLSSLKVRQDDAMNADYQDKLGQLRARIDILDEELLKTLSARMEISRMIGRYKKENNVAILQPRRFEEIVGQMKASGAVSGLDERFIEKIFSAIHDESVREQNKILSK